MNKDTSSSSPATKATPQAAAPVSSIPSTQVPAIVASVSEVCTQQSRPTPSLTTASTSSVSVSPPVTPRPASLTPSPSTQQQFTVHGQFLGPGDHCGPAPNVTVNPLYQPNVNEQAPVPLLRPVIQQQTTPPASDQQIRVLTPSEIMRTLPSLCQENYEPQPPDQEKVALQHKSAREAEQERQWKQLQALRQQQAQQQQNVIHEQPIARVQRQISDPTPFTQDQSPQELSPAVTSPSPNPRQLLSMGIKSPTFTHPTQTPMRAPTPAPTPIEFPQINTPDGDPYVKPPSTPKLPQPTFQPRLPSDSYVQPPTPRPQFQIARPTLQALNTQVRTGEGPEYNRQLRDLLQRQQFKKLDDQLLAGKGQQRVWPPVEANQESETPVVTNVPSSGDATFRQPLPPSISRPRMPATVSGIPRQPGTHLGLRMQLDPRTQGLDPRMRVLIHQQRLLQQSNTAATQQQQQQQQVFSGGTVRFAHGIVRPASVEQYEQLLPKQQAPFQPRAADQQITPRLPVAQLSTIQRPPISQTPAASSASNSTDSTNNEQEIPDNVTAELEKLEQETGTMAELQGVGDILGGLGDDDDELLAEMGADFNILEYADPEALPGEKTNILDLELEEEPIKNDKKVKQIHQQMLHQVQQAAAHGKPMPPGSKLQTTDGIIGIVTPNNNVHLQVPQSYHQRLLVSQRNILLHEVQNQKLQMRIGQNVPRIMSVAPVQQALHSTPVGLNAGPRLGVAAPPPPPPPPPPYPGPPPPYPGSTTPQQQEQPLLLEDLLEQEKREQEKQNQNQSVVNNQEIAASTAASVVEPEPSSLLSEHDFERLKADVFSNATIGINSNARQGQVASNAPQATWTQNQSRPNPTPTPTPQPAAEIRVQTFNANLLPPPPLPPENITSEQDKQKQIVYEQWLSHHNNTLTQQLRYYETEVNKLRKIRKSLNSKQRQLRKSGGQLAEADANELQRISAEQTILQKHLESSRKLSRQHGLLIQEYRNKQQAKQRPGPGQSPLLIQQNHSPLGPPSSSPIHHSNTSQSPMMSPSASPLAQHSSPLHSPSPMISHSPGPGSVTNILQSPSSIAGSSMSPMQPSPRIGTPHSQGDSSPGPVPSPSQVCLPPPAPRMTSPQHKRVVTSPVGYTGDLRPGTPQMRFVRTPLDHSGNLQQRYQPPNSPMPRSPMIGQINSPMGMRRPPSSPAMPDRPRSVENSSHPRTPYSTQSSIDNSTMLDNQSGGGNPNNPNNPIPAPPGFGRFGYFKLGLRGGSPMWSFGRGAKRIPTPPGPNKEIDKSGMGESSAPIKPKKESHLSKVSILKRKSPAKTNLQSLAVSKVGSLVSTDYNEFDDSSCTPPVTPPPISSTSRVTVQKTIGKKIPEVLENKEPNQVMIVHSPEEKQIRCDDIIDYDDDNNTVISGEVSLSSTAQQNDGDDIAVIETFSQSDLGDAMSSPLESDQIADEYLLFPGNMVVDISGETHYSDKEEEVEEDYGSENMHVVIRSPTTSDDEFIMQNKTKKYNIRRLPSNHLLSVGDNPDSPEQEEMQVDPSPEAADEDIISNYEESEIVIIDPSIKSPEEQISTKEDFEELIDEGSRKDKIMKQEVITAKHINEIHKYAANVYSFPSKTEQAICTPASVTNTNRVTNLITSKLGQKFSLITTPVVTIPRNDPVKISPDVVVTQNPKLVNTTSAPKLTNIILHNAVRSNVLNVPKLVTSGSSAITIVSASTSPIASILPPGFTVPVISASAVRQLPNVKVIDKPSSSISLTTHDSCLPKKIFEDDSVSPDSSNCEDDKSKDSSDEKSKTDSPPADFIKQSPFLKSSDGLRMNKKILLENSSEQNKATASNTQESPKAVGDAIFNKSNENERNNEEKKIDTNILDPSLKKIENLHVSTVKVHKQRIPSPVISKTSSPVIIHNTPELKMTAQVIQETQSGIQITARTETVDGFEGSSGDDTKSVVISIPSPTPSQEQMLDNIALQALENRRRDGNGMPGEFESFEDVLDMIENITGEPPTVLEDNIKDKLLNEGNEFETTSKVVVEPEKTKDNVTSKIETQIPISVTSVANVKPSVVPQLSPLSQPTDLTTNMANASQQLRTLLSSLHTTTASSSNNVETVVKGINHKVISTGSVLTSTPVVTSRVIQQTAAVTSLNTVIVPNMKQKTVMSSIIPPKSSPIRTQVTTVQSQTIANALTAVSLPRVAAINSSAPSSLQPNNITIQKAVTLVTTTSSSEPVETVNRKSTCSLTEMLQSHPAAVPTTKTSADTITAASLLGSSINLSRSGFSTSLVQAQPHVVVSPVTTNNLVFQTTSFIGISSSGSVTTASSLKPVTSTTNLLHTQLTKVIRNKSVEESMNETAKSDEIKLETVEASVDDKNNLVTNIKQESGCKYSAIQTTASSRTEDSQNALLKKLLQNTGCASTQTLPPSSAAGSITVAAPLQFNTSSLESQLKASTPTLSSILPPVVKEVSSSIAQTKTPPQRTPIMSRETSFVSSPVIQQPQTSSGPVPTTQLHIDVKRCMPPSRTPSRDDLLSPPTPRSSCSQDSSQQTPPLIVKKEITQSFQQQSSIMTPQEVKKEFVDETSQHSEVSDHSRSDVPMKEEVDALDPTTEKMLLEQKEELKKQKRRMYQQKRRQNQIMNKEAVGQPKKRPRKSSKVDEDYDTYIDGVLAQLRTLPPMVVSEPVLNRNFSILPVFGSDLSKLAASDYDSRFGELKGDYGNAVVPGYSDFYNTHPYGDAEPLPEKPPASTQRGFYDQEFPLIKFDADEDKRFDMFCREDSPDSVISSSSPECPFMEPSHKFLGLKLINEDDDEEDDDVSKMRLSPVVPIVAPIPIRLKPTGPYLKDYTEDKENVGRDMCLKSKFGSTPATPLKDSGNVTVTLTLTSSAAEDIMGVLRDLANILHIPAPTSYQIVERTSTPPSQKLGLYRTKGKDGKEGAPIDIQSILNGAAKFCKHCDVVILNNMIRKKVSELPFLSKDSELLSDGDELFFCSSACYMQFALMHRSPSIPEDKAAAIIDHLCQKDKNDFKGKRPFAGSVEQKKSFMDNIEMEYHYFKREMEPLDVSDMKSHSLFAKPTEVIKLKKYPDESQIHHPPRVWKGVRYKNWTPGCLQPPAKYKKPTDKETMELLYRLGITVTPPKMPEDIRKCMFCQGIGDGVADGAARLLNFDVDKWVHLNCGLWSDGVYETVNGALMNLENALQQSLTQICIHCNKLGATIRCFKTRCSSVYHLTCAVKDGCVFYKNKTTFCTVHIPKNEKDNELTTLSVSRRVYVNRDENRQVAAVMHHSDTNNLLRVGSLIFLSVGQLLPHQLQNFHTPNYIYPIGYKIIRFYWSMRNLNKRCKYICSIHEAFGRPEFRVVVQEPSEEDLEIKDSTPKGVWQRILEQLAAMRRENQCVQVFPKFVSGEDLFGLTEPAVVRVLESLPGIETLTDYKFKYGRNPLLELPLAINPSGAARTEPRLRNQLHWKRPHTQRTGGSSVRPLFGPTPALTNNNTLGEGACPYTKQFVHSKSSQYKKMKQEWRNNVYLARSKIQGLGLYAARDLEKHTMVIEYIGEIIRTELAETREKKYEAKNRGIYMFRLDEERVVDATLCGGLARYINHSCNPNCVAETVEVDRDYRIIIFAKRRIQRGEELAYDYKFDIEDDQHKISCMCGAPNCRKWMN
ncbi:histone-lysine N-methyltransferase 2C-like [Asbolus verrucosus]|uniref:Histone-lysine N-methyltransferase 2C-like n=1 Tax=Asbolus verrucosus TaxID=1661398 RepID=A0A482VMN9_ASBVE|nr:histone-lysine N-methyltransferase 2C-like [Asbolus verrucosus]